MPLLLALPPLLLALPPLSMGPPQLLPLVPPLLLLLDEGPPSAPPDPPAGTRIGPGGGAQSPEQHGGIPAPHPTPLGVQGGGMASIIMPASQQLLSCRPQLSTHGPPQLPSGTQQFVDIRSHTCPPGQSLDGHVSWPPQLFEMVALHRPAHVARTQHVFDPMLMMHCCPGAQAIVPLRPQPMVLPQLSSALPHSLEPQAAALPLDTHASPPESSPGATSGGASMPGASIAVLSAVVLSMVVLSMAVLSVVETSAPLLPVSVAVLVSLPGATSAPCASGGAESEPTVESAAPSAGSGMPSVMPRKKPQPPAAVAHARTNTRASDARTEAKRYPRFIS
jgi:hypothetical protein